MIHSTVVVILMNSLSSSFLVENISEQYLKYSISISIALMVHERAAERSEALF